MAVARCSNGHEWPIPSEIHRREEATPVTCPVCGEVPDHTTLPNMNDDNLSQVTKDFEKTKRDNSVTDKTVMSPSPPAKPLELPGYEIISLCGRGGMGVVYKARHTALDRLVAIKMLHAHVSPPPNTLARFQVEAQAVAHLQHPNIVQVYEVGEHEQLPYFTLEYVDGGSLSKYLKKNSLTPRQAAQMIETLARTVQYAHEQGIIHRDLKPGNILLTKDRTAKITDFGLAKRLQTSKQREPDYQSLTKSGEVLGTPSYMAPEQAVGQNELIGPATDVYALGAILYELLVGEPPFTGETPMQTQWRVIELDPVPPQELQPKVPRDLQTICLRCLRKDPQRRYATAGALADDLKAYLAGEPILARPVSRWERITMWLQRRPLAALGLGALTVAVLGLIAGAFWFSALTMSVIALFSLLAAGWWYSTRLSKAVKRINDQRLDLERNVQRLHLLMETTQLLMRTENIEELLFLLTDATTRMANAERATVFLLDEAKQQLWSKIALGDDVDEIRVNVGSGIAGTVAKTGETIHLDDPYGDARFNPEIDRKTGYKTRNLLTFPMRSSRGRILGVFQVLNKKTGTFDDDDIEILQSLAGCAAAIVERDQPLAACS